MEIKLKLEENVLAEFDKHCNETKQDRNVVFSSLISDYMNKNKKVKK